MDKEYLKGLGLSDEDADKILAKHQETVTAKDTAYADLKQKYDLKGEKPDTAKNSEATDNGDESKDNDLQEKYNLLSETQKKLESEKESALAEINAYKNKEILRKTGVDENYINFVAFEIGKNLKKGDDFTKAAEEYIKSNDQYKQKTGATSPNLSYGKDCSLDTDEEIKNALFKK